ncbi:MAG: NTP transferase domain-containing protein [Methanospirillaceae archaeon]|nr:NTP transferase domain-containing protein [Methanospirillaceae archaeon]
MQAVILAGGEGKRLRPLTHNRPKVLIPLANKPIIGHVIQSLIQAGIRDIIIVVGYRQEQVIKYISSLPLDIQVVFQDRPLGTAHALSFARELIKGNFLVLPGDNYIDEDSVRAIMNTQPDAMLTKEHSDPSNFGVVTIHNGMITHIVEKPASADRLSVSCGIYHFRRDVIHSITKKTLTEEITALIDQKREIKAIEATNWQDAIYPWGLITLNTTLLSGIQPRKGGTISSSVIIEGPVIIGSGSRIGPFTHITGPVIIGDNTDIGSHCSIGPGVSIGMRTTIDPYTSIQTSLIMNDCHIGSRSHLSSAVIGDGCTLHSAVIVSPLSGSLIIDEGPKITSFGAIIGDSVFCGPDVTIQNSIIGTSATIEGERTNVRSRIIPDKGLVI